jgi:hypothetical protein
MVDMLSIAVLYQLTDKAKNLTDVIFTKEKCIS